MRLLIFLNEKSLTSVSLRSRYAHFGLATLGELTTFGTPHYASLRLTTPHYVRYASSSNGCSCSVSLTISFTFFGYSELYRHM